MFSPRKLPPIFVCLFYFLFLTAIYFHAKYVTLSKLMDKFAHLFLYYKVKINKPFSLNLLR